ncbi:hypothetical protein FA13DRAFT_1735582 [Coprinellus micaceus]|uniref:Uncharacterized protein n=1 Tax=Coprinellus micaceus TaxID=71717 RepID=A0A4Y7T3D0_COPMI|nr:hypothetical protein FA13DRAFT_1735582 [Coprinellus micaceus]
MAFDWPSLLGRRYGILKLFLPPSGPKHRALIYNEPAGNEDLQATQPSRSTR